MLEIIPYQAHHLLALELQPAQAEWSNRILRPGYAQVLAENGEAWTGVVDGKVVGCAGLLPQWEGRMIAWAFFSPEIPRAAWPRIVAKMRAVFAVASGRVEAYVVSGHGAGCRLVQLLGFKVEGRMAKFAPDGSDCFMYAKVSA